MINLRSDGIARKETADRNKIRSDITKFLAGKLAKKLKKPGVRVPWSKMKAGDIINWPPAIEFKQVHEINTDGLKTLHELSKKDLLYFSPEFLARFKVGRVYKWTSDRDKLRSDITKYLEAKLAKKLNVPNIRVPWSELKAGDIINWPSNIELRRVKLLSAKDLERIDKLAKKDVLEFSPDFIGQRLKSF